TADERVRIEIVADEHLVNDQAAEALTADPDLYQRGGQLVRVIRDAVDQQDWLDREPNAPRITTLPLAALQDRLSRVVAFESRKPTKDGEEYVQRAPPPEFCVKAVAARGDYPGIRHLEGVVEAPVLRSDGSILDQPGYDQQTGLLYLPSGLDVRVPA